MLHHTTTPDKSSVSTDSYDVDSVTARLEEAGRTLLALPQTGPSTRLVQSGLEWVRDAGEAYGRDRTRIRPAVPAAAQITRMDEALAWIPLIPLDRYVLRRIVGARSLVSPMTGRYLFSWRRLGIAIGADHKAVQRWHAQGIDRIVASLRQRARPSHPPAPTPESLKPATLTPCTLTPGREPRPAANARS